ncbi:MAG: mandelate racemase/muconate lactonizing enzyme family protein [Clostridiales bacterium]|nr:mandelate racemase/muconate lactonizing enzyme family protein [Clostridiales bacterium]
MKIAEIKAYPLTFIPPKPFYNSVDKHYSRSVTLIKIYSDCGTYGWGEAYGPAVAGMARIIETYIKERLIGEDPFRIEYLWHKIQTKKGLPIGVLGGVDMALWDLKCKILGVPLYVILGGKFFDEFEPYGSGLPFKEVHPDSTEELEKETLDLMSHGFKAIKMKIGFGIERDKKRITRVKELIGDRVDLLVDANQAYNISSCLELLPFLEEMKVKWFEEPMPWHNFTSYKKLRERSNIAIAAGEQENNMQGFISAIQDQICDIIQPDIPAVGGITPMKRIAAIAFANNIELHPHIFGTVISLPAALQFMCSQPNYHSWCTFKPPVMIEWDTNPNSMARKLLKEPLELTDGMVKVPDKPGFGVDINEDALEEFIVK